MSPPVTNEWGPVALFVVAFVLFVWALGCSSGDPGVALPADHPWYAEADDLWRDLEADPALDGVDFDTPRCERWRASFRIARAETAGQFLDWAAGYAVCPVLPGGACDPRHDGLCVAGVYFAPDRRTPSFTAVVTPGATTDGFRTLVRHEAAHLAMLCSIGYRGHGEAPLGALVFGPGGHIWRPALPDECDDPEPLACADAGASGCGWPAACSQ